MNKANNPLNIKQVPGNWAGSTGTDGVGTALFKTPADGIRAAMRSLQSKWCNGKRTVARLTADWAPADDTQGSLPGHPPNDPGDYCRYVVQRCFLAPSAQLPDPKDDPLVWCKIVRAMARFELGEECPWSAVLAGMGKWSKDFLES